MEKTDTNTDKFDFISDDKFRAVLSRDFAELQMANESEAWKSTIILAGSIVEAVLAEHLIETNYNDANNTNPLDMTLNRILDVCKKEKILSNRTVNLADVIRDYRNLIHPGKEIRTKEIPSKNIANLTLSLLEIILQEISVQREQNRGLTANQFISKIEVDNSAAGVVGHFLNRMAKHEVERLTNSLIVKRFFELEENKSSAEWPDQLFIEETQNALAKSHREIMKIRGKTGRKTALAQIPKMIQESSDTYIQIYLSKFFSSNNLDEFKDEDRIFIIDYLHQVLEREVNTDTLRCCEGLFRHLTSKRQIREFLDCFLRPLAKEKEGFRRQLETFLSAEGFVLSGELEETFVKRLQNWQDHFESRGQEQQALTVHNVIAYVEIPF